MPDITESKTAKLLREIREDYSYFRSFWRENYDEAKIDLRFVSGDPWEPEARKEREDNARPVLSPDELDQYLNATINNLRQNPLGIKIEPKGSGADDKTAEQRQALIRNIEYDSIAQSAYSNAFSSAINCGFGFFRVTTKKIRKDSNDVEPRIKIIGNPLSVLMDPNAKEADFSDQKRCFLTDIMRQSDFERSYPKAEKRSFSPEDMSIASEWFDGENIIVAEYWRIEGYDEYGDGGTVTQYITNGLEILEETEWAGSKIPIISVLGKEVYVPKGGKMSRMFYSMIRKARGPQMMLAYIASQEAEEYGMAPRAPFVGYVGQFETDKDAWDTLNKVPRSYVQVDALTDSSGTNLGLPQRPAFIPNAQAYEIGFERWRRSLQAAMGITPLPQAAQQMGEKSGVALERIQTQQAIGSYHFTANFKLSLQNAGTQINELITKIIDTPREMAGRGQDDEQKVIHIVPGGQPQQPLPEGSETLDPQQGEFDVTVSSGASYQSQREAASDFADLMVGQIDALPIAPQAKASLLSLSIKLKDIGPLGDEMAEIINPQQAQQMPPQAQQQIGQLQQQLQLAHQMGSKLYQEVQQLTFEKKAKIVEGQNQINLEKLRIEAAVTEAEINTKAQSQTERAALVNDVVAQLVKNHHETATKAADAAHEVGMAVMGHQQNQQNIQLQAQNQSAQSSQDSDQQAQAQAAQQAAAPQV